MINCLTSLKLNKNLSDIHQHVPEVNIHETSPQSETHKSLPDPESQEITEKQPHLIRYT